MKNEPKKSGKKNQEKRSKFGDWKGAIAKNTQDAGLGSTHTNVAAPRHLSTLNPLNKQDCLLTSRLKAPTDVPAWASFVQKTEAQYNLLLNQESQRLTEKDANDERVAANDEMRRNREGFKKLSQAFLQSCKDKLGRGVRHLGDGVVKVGAQAKGSFIGGFESVTKMQSDSFGQAPHGGWLGSFNKPGAGLGITLAEAKPVHGQEPAKSRARIAVEELADEQAGDDSSPPGTCAGCGNEEYLCAHCDYVRCSTCELHMHPLPKLGALVCDRCYVWYAATEQESGAPQRWNPPPPSGIAAVALLAEKVFTNPLHVVQQAVAMEKGGGSIGVGYALGSKSFKDKEEAAEEEAATAEVGEEAEVAGDCKRCGNGEYLCAHCDTILCPHCQMDSHEALAIGAILCARCHLVWSKTRVPPELDAPGPAFPAPLDTLGVQTPTTAKPRAMT